MLVHIVGIRVTVRGNALYLNTMNASKHEVSIRLTMQQARQLSTLMPELNDLIVHSGDSPLARLAAGNVG